MKISLGFSSFLVRGGPLLLWMGVIFFFSSLSGTENPSEPTLLYYMERKGAHVIEYAVLMPLSIRFVFALFPRESFRKVLALSGVFSIAYAVSDELHQFFVPYRGAKMTDVMIDGFGILLAGMAVWLAASMRKRRNG